MVLLQAGTVPYCDVSLGVRGCYLMGKEMPSSFAYTFELLLCKAIFSVKIK